MKNILGVILVCDEQNMYTIAVKSKYARNHLDLCPQKFQTNRDANTHNYTSPSLKATTSGGQGLFRCDCGNGKNNIKPTDVF